MYIVRSVDLKDLDDIFELSKLVTFINLPPDISLIKSMIHQSVRSFEHPSKDLWKNYYIFVLENVNEKKVVGVSIIHGQHGTEESPHYYLKASRIEKYSDTIKTGFIHGTLKLGFETDGPTEIGGLVIHPDYRNNGEKLGKFLSFARFFYMGQNKSRFKEDVHVELMPPLDEDGNSPLWEAIGKRFMNMDYQEADRLSRINKEFIFSLYPVETIYVTLLSPEARDAIGKVGKDTMPVKYMLENIGFKYNQEVDPFDGGPHYRCNINDIKPVKTLRTAKIVKNIDENYELLSVILKIQSDRDQFLTIKADIKEVQKDNTSEIEIDENVMKMFSLKHDQIIDIMEM